MVALPPSANRPKPSLDGRPLNERTLTRQPPVSRTVHVSSEGCVTRSIFRGGSLVSVALAADRRHHHSETTLGIRPSSSSRAALPLPAHTKRAQERAFSQLPSIIGFDQLVALVAGVPVPVLDPGRGGPRLALRVPG